MKLIEQLIQILTEAPMSDEDRRDSAILRDIFNKRQNRSNARLTPAEKATLDKYGLTIDGQWVKSGDQTFSKGHVDRLLQLGNKSGYYNRKANKWVDAEYNNDQVNFADMARKQPERRYAQAVKNTWYDPDAAGHGDDKKRHYSDSDVTFQDKERVKTTQDSPYRQDYGEVAWATHERKTANQYLQDYDKDMKEIEDTYQQALTKAANTRKANIDYLNRKNQRAVDQRAQATQTINDIKDKYRRNN